MIGVGVSVSTISILGGEVGSGLGVDASYLNVLQDLVLAGETVAVYNPNDATTINVARDGSGDNPGPGDPAGRIATTQGDQTYYATAPSDNGRATWNVDTDPTLYDVSGAVELVTNGGVDVDTTSWTAGNFAGSDPTLSVVAGAMRVTNNAAGGNGYASQAISTEVGKAYLASALVTPGTATTPRFAVGTSAGGAQYSNVDGSATGVRSIVFVATATTAYITGLTNSVAGSVYADFDNLSLREIPASQLKHHLTLDGVDDGYDLGVTPADDMTLIVAMRTSDTQFIIGDDILNSGARHGLVAADGDAGTGFTSNAGSPTFRINGVAQSFASRDAAHSALATGNMVVLTQNDLDIATWDALNLGLYTSHRLSGDIAWIGVFTGLTTAQLEIIEAEAARAVGLTL